MNDSLGDRMKGYEGIPKQTLMRRTPVVIRLDGRAFHTFANGVEKPFDAKLSQAMRDTAKALLGEVQNCKLAYTQSDEISLLLIDYENLETENWFANDLQKIVSVSASFATAYFNSVYKHAKGKLAVFDSRAFNVPKEEVSNYFLWRQNDARRNGVSQIARAFFSHKQLHGKSVVDMTHMLTESGHPVDSYQLGYRNGFFITKEGEVDAPLITENRDVVDNHVYVGYSEDVVVEKVETLPLSDKAEKIAERIFKHFPKE